VLMCSHGVSKSASITQQMTVKTSADSDQRRADDIASHRIADKVFSFVVLLCTLYSTVLVFVVHGINIGC